ncbi:MAG: hypothetical protein H6745_14940 [Deltaproteobacteria bacterium]|nr:hypothetical protein [Deltaproteobacteria bacterium]
MAHEAVHPEHAGGEGGAAGGALGPAVAGAGDGVQASGVEEGAELEEVVARGQRRPAAGGEERLPGEEQGHDGARRGLARELAQDALGLRLGAADHARAADDLDGEAEEGRLALEEPEAEDHAGLRERAAGLVARGLGGDAGDGAPGEGAAVGDLARVGLGAGVALEGRGEDGGGVGEHHEGVALGGLGEPAGLDEVGATELALVGGRVGEAAEAAGEDGAEGELAGAGAAGEVDDRLEARGLVEELAVLPGLHGGEEGAGRRLVARGVARDEGGGLERAGERGGVGAAAGLGLGGDEEIGLLIEGLDVLGRDGRGGAERAREDDAAREESDVARVAGVGEGDDPGGAGLEGARGPGASARGREVRGGEAREAGVAGEGGDLEGRADDGGGAAAGEGGEAGPGGLGGRERAVGVDLGEPGVGVGEVEPARCGAAAAEGAQGPDEVGEEHDAVVDGDDRGGDGVLGAEATGVEGVEGVEPGGDEAGALVVGGLAEAAAEGLAVTAEGEAARGGDAGEHALAGVGGLVRGGGGGHRWAEPAARRRPSRGSRGAASPTTKRLPSVGEVRIVADMATAGVR